MTMPQRSSRRPLLIAYAVGLAVVWTATILTWTVRSGSIPELSPIAQLLQYLLVLVASSVAALVARRPASEDDGEAAFGFDNTRWIGSNDAGGRAFWQALTAGAVTMLVNIAILIVADALIGAGDLGTWLAWVGGGLAVGCLLGLAGAMVASALALVLRRVAHA